MTEAICLACTSTGFDYQPHTHSQTKQQKKKKHSNKNYMKARNDIIGMHCKIDN